MTRPTPPRTLLLTSVGNDGFPAVLAALRAGGGRRVRIIGADADPAAPGLYLSDRGVPVPPRRRTRELVERLLALCDEESVQALWPLSTEDQDFYARHAARFEARGVRVLVSSPEALAVANDKGALYAFARRLGVACPGFEPVRNLAELESAARGLGFPERPFVLKATRGSGAQGLKIVHAALDGRRRLMDRDNRHVGFDELCGWLATASDWPELVATEYLPGEEYSVDLLCHGGQVRAAVTRLRLEALYGLALRARVVEAPDVEREARRLVGLLGLRFVVNVQLRRDAAGRPKLLEVNPRIPGTVGLSVAAGVNLPWLALRLALGERVRAPRPRTGTTGLRHWDSVYLAERQLLAAADGRP